MAMKRLFIASSLLAMSATSTLLSGCGEDNPTPGATASPSSETPGTVTTASYLAAVRNTTTPGTGGAEDTVTSVLSLVDDTTGTEVTTTPIDAYGTPKMAQAFTVAADGKSYQAGRQTRAYYVYQHKLYEISLEHTGNVLSKPVARQVSSEANACEVRRVVERDGNAQTSYLSYTTAGTDGKCNTPDDTPRTTLSSVQADVTASAPALLEVQRDASGSVTGLLGNDIDNHKLVIINAAQLDAGKLQVTNVVNGGLTGSTSTDTTGQSTTSYPTVSVFGKVAGSIDKVYLRVGADVRVLDWSNTTLGASPVATLNLDQPPLVHTDDTATYFVDAAKAALSSDAPSNPTGAELVLWRLKPTQSSAERVTGLGATTPDQLPQVATNVMTPSSLAMVVRRDSGDTLTVIKKADGSKRDVPLSGPTSRVGIQAHAGEVLVISQQLNTGEDASALTRVNLGNSDSLSTLSASASLVTVINDTSTTIGGEMPSSYLLWNESSAVHSHSLSGNTTLTIANSSTLTGWNGGTLSAAVSNLTVGLLRGLTSATPNAETLWLFNATKATGAN